MEPIKGEYIIRVAPWKNYNDEIDEDTMTAVNAKVTYDTTIAQLANSIAVSLKYESVTLYAKSYANEGKTLIKLNYSEKTDITLKNLKLYEWSLIYAESSTETGSWENYFDDLRTRIFISFNHPNDAEPKEYIYRIKVNKNNTINEVRARMSELLNIEPLSFIMRRGSKLGPEIKNREFTLGSMAFIKNSTIYIENGIPKNDGEYYLQIALVTLADGKEDCVLNCFKPLVNIIISGKSTFKQLKERIANHYINALKQNVDIECLRIRDTNGERATSIMRDNDILESSYIYDFKSYCVELLKQKESIDEDSIQVYCREWLRDSYTLGPIIQIIASKIKPIKQLGELLSVNNKATLEIAKVSSVMNFNRGMCPTLQWVNINDEGVMIADLPLMILSDGALLIYADMSVKLRQVSEEDKIKLGIREYFPIETQFISESKGMPHKKEKGIVIKIKTPEEQKIEIEKQKSEKEAQEKKETLLSINAVQQNKEMKESTQESKQDYPVQVESAEVDIQPLF